MNKDKQSTVVDGLDYRSKTTAPQYTGVVNVRAISSEDLFGKDSEIAIVHEGSLYRLRKTRGGKLILNK